MFPGDPKLVALGPQAEREAAAFWREHALTDLAAER